MSATGSQDDCTQGQSGLPGQTLSCAFKGFPNYRPVVLIPEESVGEGRWREPHIQIGIKGMHLLKDVTSCALHRRTIQSHVNAVVAAHYEIALLAPTLTNHDCCS